jgi:hypothetical protein
MTINLGNLPAIWGGSTPQQVSPPTEISPRDNPSLATILYQFGPFPPYSLIIGQCIDGLPFMLDLDNPRSGAILVVGEHAPAKIRILSTMSTSACRINDPEEVCWSVISASPHQYAELVKSPHCQAVINPHERAAGELIHELASVVEQRRFGRERGSIHVLMVDNFQSFAPMLSDYNTYLNLKSLISKGPGCGIWPLISADPDDAYSAQGNLLRTFGTYIFEKNERDSNIRSPIRSGINYSPGFNVIVGGRLIPISSISI